VRCCERLSSFTNLKTEIQLSRRSDYFLRSPDSCFPAYRAVKNGVVLLDRRGIAYTDGRRKIFQMGHCPLYQLESFFVFCHGLDYSNSSGMRIQLAIRLKAI
jgi:hypothetical protein